MSTSMEANKEADDSNSENNFIRQHSNNNVAGNLLWTYYNLIKIFIKL